MSDLSPGSHGGAFRTPHGIVVGQTGEAAAAMRARGMSEAQIRRNLGLRGVAPGRGGNSGATPNARPGETAPAKRRAAKPRPSLDAILAACAAAAGLSVAHLTARGKAQGAAQARHLAAYLIRQAYPEMTWRGLGRVFGIDHASARYGALAAEGRLYLEQPNFTALHDRAVEILEGGA